MRNFLIIFAVAGMLLVSSCGEGIKPRPASTPQISSVEKKSTPIKRGKIGLVKPKAFSDYNIKFWDSLDSKKFPAPSKKIMIGASASLQDAAFGHDNHKVRGRNHAAYKLGFAFSSDDEAIAHQRVKFVNIVVPSVLPDSVSTIEGNPEIVFMKCVSTAEQEGEVGISALMTTGYYFGALYSVIGRVNYDTKLPDEKTLANGITKLGELKEYLNSVIKAEKEVKTTMLLQRIEERADSITNVYRNCTMKSSDDDDKYGDLLSLIKDTDRIFY